MTEVIYHLRCETRPHQIEIDEWRTMEECTYGYGNHTYSRGTRMILKDTVVEILGYTPPMIRKSISKNETIRSTIFTLNNRLHPGWCDKCQARGKLDWVSIAMNKPTRSHPHTTEQYAKTFVRDRDRVLFYRHSKLKTSKIEWDLVFAPSVINNDQGETRCKECYGTGLRLDARMTIFTGMPGIKYQLTEFEWDGLNIPTANKVSRRGVRMKQ